MGGDGFDFSAEVTDLDTHTIVGNCIEFNGGPGAEMTDEFGPQPRTIGLDVRIEIEPHGKRRRNIRILMAGKDDADIPDTHILGQFGKDLGEYLDASGVQQHGLASTDDDVLVRIDDVSVFVRITADHDPLVTVFIEECLALHHYSLSGAIPPSSDHCRSSSSWHVFWHPVRPPHVRSLRRAS